MLQKIKCWLRHRFEIQSEFTKLNVIPGAHLYRRKCVRCGLEQHVSTFFGLHFLDKEILP